jgi:hypothetical protein
MAWTLHHRHAGLGRLIRVLLGLFWFRHEDGRDRGDVGFEPIPTVEF